MNQMIYPGDFVPMHSEEEVMSAVKKSDKGVDDVQVNITELPDSYKVEVDIPGVKSDNILVIADQNKLSVSVLKKAIGPQQEESIKKKEFSYVCLEEQIEMPDDADMSFVVAEYRNGILEIYVQKSEYPILLVHNRIVVY